MAPDLDRTLPPGRTAVRYVVLAHTGVTPEHFDLMVLVPGAETLLTWRILAAPATWAETSPEAQRIADHRLAYLEYEGEISGNRGRVRRVLSGNGWLVREEGGWGLHLEGGVRVGVGG